MIRYSPILALLVACCFGCRDAAQQQRINQARQSAVAGELEKQGVALHNEKANDSGSANTGSDRTITTSGVGDYQIGQSTLAEILGADTPEHRKRFADAGLNFEFNQEKELTAVTVTSRDYSLENGLSVGSTSSEVRNKLGEPITTSIELEPKGIQLDTLVYTEFTFLLDQSNEVSAIRVGR